jgi:hypothetical protein
VKKDSIAKHWEKQVLEFKAWKSRFLEPDFRQLKKSHLFYVKDAHAMGMHLTLAGGRLPAQAVRPLWVQKFLFAEACEIFRSWKAVMEARLKEPFYLAIWWFEDGSFQVVAATDDLAAHYKKMFRLEKKQSSLPKDFLKFNQQLGGLKFKSYQDDNVVLEDELHEMSPKERAWIRRRIFKSVPAHSKYGDSPHYHCYHVGRLWVLVG